MCNDHFLDIAMCDDIAVCDIASYMECAYVFMHAIDDMRLLYMRFECIGCDGCTDVRYAILQQWESAPTQITRYLVHNNPLMAILQY